MATIGIDFGTSNTAAGVCHNDRPHILPIEGQSNTLPTAVFLDFHSRETQFGRAAVDAMMSGEEGRFMRALKSVLGTPLAREKRQFLNERMSLIEVVARFLAEIRSRAEDHTGLRFTSVVSGRPVRFHSASESRNAQALADLTDAYRLAGFETIRFLAEPEAAALAVGGTGRILIVDIGGGTSDFTLCDREGERTQILASGGLRLGGTDFDKRLSLAHAMPHLGYGAEIGAELGQATHEAPRRLFQDLASWEKIAFVYSPALLRDVRRWTRLAPNPRRFERLANVLDMHLGHDVAFAVEAAKIAANDATAADIDLSVVEKGLRPLLSHVALQTELQDSATAIASCAVETVMRAGCTTDSVERVVFVGGSSLLRPVEAHIRATFGSARFETSEVFTAVVAGLAIAAGTTQ